MSNKVIVQSLKTGQLVVTIPKAIADMKRWKKGTVLEFTEHYGELAVKEVRK